MKKFFPLLLLLLVMNAAHAQVDTAATLTTARVVPATTVTKPKAKYDLSKRPNDHFMFQLGYLTWTGKPDSITTKGFDRSINTYFMFDFPFKAAQQFSVGAGLGIGSDNMILSKHPDLQGATTALRFDTAYKIKNIALKKSSLKTTYLELPIELRWVQHPDNTNSSFKVALGVKVGTMIKAGTRNVPDGSDYKVKESSKKYFNTTRAAATARIGYGPVSVFGTYQLTTLLKEGAGPQLRPLTIGLQLSGL